MSLKDLTAERHRKAEATPFMKAIFAKTLPLDLWIDFTYQKSHWYAAIEKVANELGLLKELAGIQRSMFLWDDYRTMTKDNGTCTVHATTEAYCQYINSITDSNKIMAHLYTWHMGDMYGGQMISKLISVEARHLIFENRVELITKMRELINDSMADEANLAFDWAIKLLDHYDC